MPLALLTLSSASRALSVIWSMLFRFFLNYSSTSSCISSLRTPAINPRVLSIWDCAMKQSGGLYKLKRLLHKNKWPGAPRRKSEGYWHRKSKAWLSSDGEKKKNTKRHDSKLWAGKLHRRSGDFDVGRQMDFPAIMSGRQALKWCETRAGEGLIECWKTFESEAQ